MEEESAPASPPLSKGAYTIDWDNLDENTNPFASGPPKMGGGMANSPPVGGGGMAHSPPVGRGLANSPPVGRGLAHSPPNSSKVTQPPPVDNQPSENANHETPQEIPLENETEPKPSQPTPAKKTVKYVFLLCHEALSRMKVFS